MYSTKRNMCVMGVTVNVHIRQFELLKREHGRLVARNREHMKNILGTSV